MSAAALPACGSSEGAGSSTPPPMRGAALVEMEDLVTNLAIDGEHVFWTEGGSLWKVPVDGGDPIEVGDASGESFALDATHAYFANGIVGTVTKLPKDGGEPVVIVSGEKEPTSIAVDDSGVYFANWSSYDNGPVADGSVARADKDGANLAHLADGLIYPRSLALDAEGVYFASASEERVYRVDKAGGTPAVIAEGQYDPNFLAVDDSGVYLRTRNHPDDPESLDAVVRADKAGAGATVVTTEERGIGAVALHAGWVYYTRAGDYASCDRPSGLVRRVATSGGAAEDVAVEQSDPLFIAVDATGIYWTNGSAASSQCKQIMKAALPGP